MKLKDKLKTAALATTTFILTSCGLGTDKAPEVEERSDDKEARGLPEYNGIHRDPTGKSQEDWYFGRAYTGELANFEITGQLERDKIPVAKEDSLLHDVEIDYDYHDKQIKLSNPHYALNKKTRDNKEYHGDVLISKKIDPDQKPETYELDEETIGVKDLHNETISEKISEVRKLVTDKKVEAQLQKGDTVKVDQGHLKATAVVEKDGVSPVVKNKYTRYRSVSKLIFDYKAKQPE